MKDSLSELGYYEKLSLAYTNAGDPVKMVAYHKRAFNGLVESEFSDMRSAALAKLSTK